MQRVGSWAFACVALLGYAGCAIETKPKPFPPGQRIDLLSARDISSGPGEPIADHDTADIVEPLLEHRTMYARYLQALSQFYDDHGYLNKQRWANTELGDLRRVPTYSYGADVGQLKLQDIEIAGRKEVDLVEPLVAHRRTYTRLLGILVRHYAERQDYAKLAMAERERDELTYVKPYQYLMSATIPIAALRPTESIAEADALYNEGLALMKKAGYKRWPGFFNERVMKQALNKFHTLLLEYPTSDKIDEAAYYLGYIHKEYFTAQLVGENDDEIAVEYFERAYTWNPDIQLQARFEAATVYDYRLHDREKALQLYQEVVDRETFVRSNVDFAHRRIRQLLAELPEKRNAVSDAVVKSPSVPPPDDVTESASPTAPSEPTPAPAPSDRPLSAP